MKHVRMAAMVALLTACAAPVVRMSDVTPAGSGNYLLRGKPTKTMDWGDIKAKTLAEADAYCKRQGKQMEQVSANENGVIHWSQQEYELTFTCK